MKTLIFILATLLVVPLLQAQLTNNGNLQFHSGMSIAIKGDFANNGSFADSSKTVILNGNSVQSISGSAATGFNNLTLVNASGAQLQRNVFVTKTLVLESGPIELNSNTLTILNDQTTAISRINGYIECEKTDNSSIVAWQISSTVGSHIIPLATSTGEYIPFTVSVTSGDVGLFSLSTYPTSSDNTPLPVSPVTVTHLFDLNYIDNSSNVADRFWHLTKSGVGGVATLTFTIAATEAAGVSTMIAQRWNESAQGWDAPLPEQTATATSVTVPDVSSFSTWALASSDNPLPVELLTFIAEKNDKTVLVSWTTATETNNDYFVIEKTTDFVHFSEVTQIDAAGNSNMLINYSITDYQPFSGVSYYRLQQTDFSGQTEYSEFAAVNFDPTNQTSVMVYPIPATAGELNIRLNNFNDGPVLIEITDMQGRCKYSKMFEVNSLDMDFWLPDTEFLGEGPMLIIVSGFDGMTTQKILIRKK